MFSLRFGGGGPVQTRGIGDINHSIENMIDAGERLKKPLFLITELTGDARLDMINGEASATLNHHGIPIFPSFEIAAKVLGNLKAYNDFLQIQ
jgi:hypothetical protein